MLRKFFIRVFCVLFLVFLFSDAGALTDPEPNPFADMAEGEAVFEAMVIEASEEILTIENTNGETFSGRMEAIFKYRDGGGPAAAEEFFAGDEVRVLVNSEGVVLATQNAELLLCEQNFYGWARNPTTEKFELETVEVEAREDMAYETGKYTTTVQPAEGKSFTRTGKYVVVWKHQAGSWKIDVDIWNTTASATRN